MAIVMLGPDKRDGSSPSHSFSVNSVHEEYAWIERRYPGFTCHQQQVIFQDDKPYDILTLRNQHGDELAIYFDVSHFYGND